MRAPRLVLADKLVEIFCSLGSPECQRAFFHSVFHKLAYPDLVRVAEATHDALDHRGES